MLLPLLTILQQYHISHYVFYYENWWKFFMSCFVTKEMENRNFFTSNKLGGMVRYTFSAKHAMKAWITLLINCHG